MKRIALIGFGQWGKHHARILHEMNALTAIVDSSPIVRARLGNVFPGIKCYSSLPELLEKCEFEGAVIATPAENHYETATILLQAKKDILVEKPLALFSKQAQELERIASHNQCVLMVGHLLLYHPAIHKIKELIKNNALGKLQYIYSNRLNLGVVRKEENILWSFAPHDISVLQYLVESDPIEVDAKGAIIFQPGIHDVTITTLRYPQNVYAHIHVSWVHPFKEHRLVIIGDKSMIVFEDSKKEHKLLLYPKGIDWLNGEPIKREGEFQVITYSEDEPLKLELQHFLECMETRSKPLTDGEHAIKVLRILELAQERLQFGATSPLQSGNKEEPSSFFVHPTAVIDEGCEVGEGTKVWHFSHVQKGTRIGKHCTLGQNVNVGNNVRVGNNVKIQNNVSVYEGVTLEDYVFCGPSMVFTNVIDPRSEFPQRGSKYYHKTLVQYGASIGANATVVCGHTIGRFAFIGAGAVVTKDIPDYALVVGNPARIVGWMCRCGNKLEFIDNRATCARCKRKYRKDHDRVVCEQEEEVAVALDE